VEKPAKNTVCLWYDRDAEDAARFYAETFPDSSVTAVHREEHEPDMRAWLARVEKE
jgi:predicted 3-demethylubiquinone-9 3-methyltransferase (glyoxalase superfamily)